MHGEDAPKRDTEQLWYTLHETEWLKTEALGGPLFTAGTPGGINKLLTIFSKTCWAIKPESTAGKSTSTMEDKESHLFWP